MKTRKKNQKQRAESSYNDSYERLSVGVDIGTSHCEVLAFGKTFDLLDEEKSHYTEKPVSIHCTSSWIMFAKDNESSINFVRRFQSTHKIEVQEEYLNGKKIPYVFQDQVEALWKKKKVTGEEYDILRRSTNMAAPIKTKPKNEEYSELETAVIRLNIERILKSLVQDDLPLDITFAKPCEAGESYDKILMDVVAKLVNQNMSNDNRFIIRSEAVFTGHYLLNMLEGSYGTLAVCDIGAGTGDVYIFDQDDSSTKVMKTFTTAGNLTTRELMWQLKENSNVDISERDANLLKEEQGFITGFNSPNVIKPIPVDLYIQGKPRKVRAGKSLEAAGRPMAQEAVATIAKVFKEYEGVHPPTIALTGFQGQMEGLDKAIEDGLHLENYTVTVRNLKSFGESDPRIIVAKGAEGYSRSIRNEKWTIL